MDIPVLDLGPEIEFLWDELQVSIRNVLKSGHFIMGPNVKAFEEEVAQYLGVKHAVGLNSGTDALFIALRTLGIGPGDEVITSPFSFFATAEAISHVGATPVFVDVRPDTFTLDVDLVKAAITPRSKAIIPVHIFGQAADMGLVMECAAQHGLKVVEDVAQAFGGEYQGKKLGTIGDLGAFSFFPTKNLGAYGDGGLLVTNDDNLADTARMLRAHGSKVKYQNELVGYNSRLDELQAAILRVKLPRVDQFNNGRREAAYRYNDLLSSFRGVAVPFEAQYGRHVYHQYTVRIKSGRREEVREVLQAQGIQTMVYYPTPIHRLPVYQEYRCVLPHAELAASEVLSLPIWAQIQPEIQKRVARVLAIAMGA